MPAAMRPVQGLCDTTLCGMAPWDFADCERIAGCAVDAMPWAMDTGVVGAM